MTVNEYEWHPWFAWWPVYVDAYNVAEISKGRLRYKVWMRWVECCVIGHVVSEDECPDAAGELSEEWKYRLPQPATPALVPNDFARVNASDVDPTAGLDPKFNWDGDG